VVVEAVDHGNADAQETVLDTVEHIENGNEAEDLGE
jgi:hypothetical protein